MACSNCNVPIYHFYEQVGSTKQSCTIVSASSNIKVILVLHSFCSYCHLSLTLDTYYSVIGNNAVSLTCHTLCMQWLTHRSILLSGDVKTNTGTPKGYLSFCSWNLNSVCTHDFLRVSLIEAYNTVYNYDLIGVVETHHDSTVGESKLDIDRYSFYKSTHPENGKRGGVGFYVKESLPAREGNDLETLPECLYAK